jgi:hypothetical protein
MVRTGSQIRPTPWVKYRGRMLTVGEDYTYSYGENIDGTGTVTVRLIGKRSTATATFRIISKGDPKQA